MIPGILYFLLRLISDPGILSSEFLNFHFKLLFFFFVKYIIIVFLRPLNYSKSEIFSIIDCLVVDDWVILTVRE